jgi:hypothetical protein
MPTLEEIVHGYFSSLPHPKAPALSVGDFPVATRLATMLKFGQGHASPQEAENFWHEYQTMNQNLQAQNKAPIGPEEFTHLAQQMARSSFAYHGRPPSMYEIQRMRDADPKAISDYYGALPDEHYPTVSAADMAKTLHAARPWAQQYAQREPSKLEAAYLHASGQSPADYYQQAAKKDGTNDQGGPPDPGAAGAGDAGRQPPDQRADDPRLASGPAAAGGGQGVPAR